MIDYLIQGFRLHQPDQGFRLLADSQYSSSIAPRRVNLTVPLMHGQIPAWNDPLDSTTVMLRVRITDPDPTQLEHKWNYLRSLCLLGGNRPVILVREVGTETTTAQVQLESMTQPDFNYAGNFVTTTMVFHNPSGRWRASEAEEQFLSLNTPNQALLAASRSNAPISDALIRVRGPVSRVEVVNDANGTGLIWQSTSTISASRWLLIDCEGFTAWSNTNSNWETRGDNVSRWLLTQGNGPLTLTPITSLNTVNNSSAFSVQASGTSSQTQVHVRARRTYV